MTENAAPLSVFITGGSTGTGRALTRDLVRQGHKVTGTTTSSEGAAAIRADGGLPTYPDLSRVGDVRGLLQMAKADVLVHLAATGLNDVPLAAGDLDAARAALAATDELVIAAGQAGVKRIILVSSAFAYGNTDSAVDEDTELSHDNPLFAEVIHAETAVLDGGIPGYVLRSGFIYGSGSAGSQALADVMRRGQGVVSGKSTAAWVHEEDLASAVALLVTRADDAELSHVYNVADDVPATADQFATEFGTVLGTGEPSKLFSFIASRRTSPAQKVLLDTSFTVKTDRIKGIGWKPAYPNRTAGLERMLMLWRAATAADTAAPALPERAIVTL